MKIFNKNILNAGSQSLNCRSIGFIRLIKREEDYDPVPAGTGIVLEYQKLIFILTVWHIAKEIPKWDKLGLIMSSDEHRIAYNPGEFQIFKIGEWKNHLWGPDLALVSLPTTAIEQLKNHRVPYSISKHRSTYSNNFNSELWMIFGFPSEFVTNVPSNGSFKYLKRFMNISGVIGKMPEPYIHENYDYYDIVAKLGEKYISPKDFDGVSGGGIWKLEIDQNADGIAHVKKCVLMGVAFRQDQFDDENIHIRCHGPLSIYKHILDYLESEFV